MSLTSYRTAPPRVTGNGRHKDAKRAIPERKAPSDWLESQPPKKARTCEWVLTVFRLLQCLATSYSSNA